jgi:dipeptidyl aminopeptidase/acylaminoacyl peptidase
MSRSLVYRRAILLPLLALVLFSPSVAQQSPPSPSPPSRLRALTPRDILRLDEIGQVVLSPDGLLVAYVLRNSAASVLENSSKSSDYSISEDIWIAPTSGGRPQKITNNTPAGTIFTQVIFSPDGQRLAFICVRNWEGSVWVWDRTSGQVSSLVTRGVNFGSSFERTLTWGSDHELMYSIAPEGPRPPFLSIRESTEAAARAWTAARSGKEPTVSVIDSGVNVPYDRQSTGKLMLLNVITGSQQFVTSGDFSDMQPSPDGRYVAVLRQAGFIRPEAGELLRHPSAQTYGFTVRTAGGEAQLGDTSSVKDIIGRSFRWSPDSSQLALAGRSQKPGDGHLQLFVYTPAEGRLTAINSDHFAPAGGVFQSPPEMAWTAKNELLALGSAIPSGANPTESETKTHTRADWWIVTARGPQRNLTERMTSAPSRLIPESDGESFLGVADGELWRINPSGTMPENMTRDFPAKVTSIVWPRQGSSDSKKLTKVIVSVSGRSEPELYCVELRSAKLVSLPIPSSAATLRDFSAQSGVAVFVANDRTGTYLSISQSGMTQSRAILATNTFLGGVSEGLLKKIHYPGMDGQDLICWLILPITYEEGSRYPLVVRVYPGTVYGDNPPDIAKINQSHPLNLQLLAAHGYAVLLPSMPLKSVPEPSDPFMELTKGVLPAIDKVIELGVADPQRLGLFGQSFGGYSTYGLVVQTTRFKAAVAMAGLSDLISLYGQFNATDRYSDAPQDNSFNMSLAESGQTRMGNPPWKDIGRYLRNSPIFYVDRVQTPLMIIQGDMDYVAMQQGEEFFTALYRQNKRARFVRYWGEGHVIGSNPANVNDMWDQIFAWFDGFLLDRSSNNANKTKRER